MTPKLQSFFKDGVTILRISDPPPEIAKLAEGQQFHVPGDGEDAGVYDVVQSVNGEIFAVKTATVGQPPAQPGTSSPPSPAAAR